MSESLTCPVCGRQGVPAGSKHCPQCEADLTCFQVLDSLPDELETPITSGGEKTRPLLSRAGLWLIAATLVLILGLHAVLISRQTHLEDVFQRQGEEFSGGLDRVSRELEDIQASQKRLRQQAERFKVNQKLITRLEAALTQIQKDKQTLEEKIAAARSSTGQVSPPDQRAGGSLPVETENEQSDFRVYQATEDDTLWEIARRHLGKGKYYPLLLEDNPGLGIYDIGKGVSLRVFKNLSAVDERYNRIVEQDNGRTYWKYTVVAGDTIAGIARKVYGSSQGISKITALNPGASLKPGTRITMELQ